MAFVVTLLNVKKERAREKGDRAKALFTLAV